MRELGVDVERKTPKKLTREMAERADVVVTMGCGDECPYIPGKRYIDWDLPTRRGFRSIRCGQYATTSGCAFGSYLTRVDG